MPVPAPEDRVCAVLVAHERRELLGEALRSSEPLRTSQSPLRATK